MENPKPKIFIGGMQRSGTSLVRALIGSNEGVAIFPYDLLVFRHIYEKYKDRKLGMRGIKSVVGDIYRQKKVKLAKQVSQVPSMESLLRELEKSKGSKTSITCLCVVEAFLTLYMKRQNASTWGLKTPRNEFWAGEILSKWRDAKIIHVIRDPRDVMASLINYENIDFKVSCNPIRHRTAEVIKGKPISWRDEWCRSTLRGLRYSRRYPNRYIISQFEDILRSPKKEVKSMCDFLGIHYQRKMLKMDSQPGWSGSNSSYEQDMKKVHTDPINQYKDRIDETLIFYAQSNKKS